jgi:molecular chaperone GrpE
MSKRSEMENDNKDAVSPEQTAGAAKGADGSPAEASATSPSVEMLQQQLAEKDKELADLKDKYLRVLADAENARKRIRQQSEDSVRVQRENFLRDLLPIVDNLERAVEAAQGGGSGQSIVEGVEMVLRALLDFLRANGVTQMNSVGQTFDPQLHEAVDQVQSSHHPPNTVVSEFHRGYVIGDRTLRPARVAVTKGHQGHGGSPGAGGDSNGGGIENK